MAGDGAGHGIAGRAQPPSGCGKGQSINSDGGLKPLQPRTGPCLPFLRWWPAAERWPAQLLPMQLHASGRPAENGRGQLRGRADSDQRGKPCILQRVPCVLVRPSPVLPVFREPSCALGYAIGVGPRIDFVLRPWLGCARIHLMPLPAAEPPTWPHAWFRDRHAGNSRQIRPNWSGSPGPCPRSCGGCG